MASYFPFLTNSISAPIPGLSVSAFQAKIDLMEINRNINLLHTNNYAAFLNKPKPDNLTWNHIIFKFNFSFSWLFMQRHTIFSWHNHTDFFF